MRIQRCCIFLILALLFVLLSNLTAAPEGKKLPTPQDLVRDSVRELLKLQEDGGQWPYECSIDRDEEEDDAIPIPFRVACTSIVAQTLLFAAPDDSKVQAAVQRALTFVLEQLDHPKMELSTEEQTPDFRVWGQGYALEFLCHARACKILGTHAKEVQEWIPRLVQALVEEEIPDGGWSYFDRNHSITCTIPPITQALLLARSQGEKVPDEIFQHVRTLLERFRTEEGGYLYPSIGNDYRDDEKPEPDNAASLPGSAGRAGACEATLFLLGGSSIEAVRFSLANFFENSDQLEERRQQSGTHEGDHAIAPYYFYYSHRYTAQTIQMLPQKDRAKERERLLEIILKTRDEDGTWNDRDTTRARYFGTAMVVLALLGDKAPLPPKLVIK